MLINRKKYIAFGIFVFLVVFLGITGLVPYKVAPKIFSILDSRSYSQSSPKYMTKGYEIVSYGVGHTPTSIDLINMGTKKLALVTSIGDSSISIIDLNEGKVSSLKLPEGSKPRVSVWCDINNDEHEEIVVPLWGEKKSSIFVGEIDNNLRIKENGEYNVGFRPRSVACADLDGDGFNEIVSADNFSDTISIIDNSEGSLKYLKSISVGREPGAVSIIDFNGDGHNDILVSHRKSNNAYLFAQISLYEFKLSATFPTSDSPKDQIVTDIDGDGDVDVVTADGDSNMVSIFFMDGIDISRIQRVKVSGSPHSIKYVPINEKPGTGLIVVSSYPNWIEVIKKCSLHYELINSYWFGKFNKRKILYLDYDSTSPENIYAVMAGIDKVVGARISLSICE